LRLRSDKKKQQAPPQTSVIYHKSPEALPVLTAFTAACAAARGPFQLIPDRSRQYASGGAAHAVQPQQSI